MSSYRSMVVTGVFFILAIVTFFLLMIRALDREETVDFVAYFDDVALLADGARVAVNGIEVGSVTDLDVDDTTQGDQVISRVRVKFSVKEGLARKLRVGTRAAIAQEGLLGSRFLRLIPELNGDQPLPTEEIHGVSHLRVEGQPFSDMFTKLDELGTSLKPALARAGSLLEKIETQLLSAENVENFGALLENARGLFAELRETVARVENRFMRPDGTIDQLERLMGQAEATLASLEADVTRVSDKAVGTMENADVLLTNTDRAVQDVAKAVTGRVVPKVEEVGDEAVGLMNRLERRIDPLADKVESSLDALELQLRNPDIQGAVYDLRLLMQEARLLVVSLRADPSQLIWGGPGPVTGGAEKPRDDGARRRDGRPARYDY